MTETHGSERFTVREVQKDRDMERERERREEEPDKMPRERRKGWAGGRPE